MTGFANQIRWVLFSYISRPIVLGLVALGVILIPYIAYLHRFQIMNPIYPQIPRGTLRVDSAESLARVRTSGQQAKVDAIDLSELWTSLGRQQSFDPDTGKGRWILPEPKEEFFSILREFPNVRIVHWDIHRGFPGAAEISQLEKLEYLSINAIYYRTANVLSFASHIRSPVLKYIKLDSQVAIRDIDKLAKIPKLETLCFGLHAVDDETLAEVAKLPHLKDLVLAFGVGSPSREPMTSAGFRSLAQSRSLNHLYVGSLRGESEYTKMFHDLAATTLKGKKGPIVLPTHESHSRQASSLFPSLLPYLFFAAAIGVQLSTQFMIGVGRLVPRNIAFHGGIGTFLTLLLLTAVSKSWLDGGASLLAAATIPPSYCLAVLALASTTAGLSQPREKPSYLTMANAIGLGGFLLLSVCAILMAPEQAEKLGRRTDPVSLGMFPFVSLISIAFTIHTLKDLSYSLDPERRRPLSLRSFFIDRQLQIPEKRFARPWRAQESAIENLRSMPIKAEDRWRRLMRWRLGNLPAPALLPIVITLACWFSISIMRWLLQESPSPISPIPMAAGMGFIAGAGQVAIALRRRLLTFDFELQKPMRRRQVLTDTLAAALIDLIVPSLIFSLGMLIAIVPADGGSAFTSLLWSLAVGLWLGLLHALLLTLITATTRRLWLATFLDYLILCSVFLSLSFHSFWSTRVGYSVPSLLWMEVVVISFLGLLASAYLIRKWFRMEFGLG